MIDKLINKKDNCFNVITLKSNLEMVHIDYVLKMIKCIEIKTFIMYVIIEQSFSKKKGS